MPLVIPMSGTQPCRGGDGGGGAAATDDDTTAPCSTPRLYLQRTRCFSVISAKPERRWPPVEWLYSKTIVGSQASKYDYRYISTFNFEEWNRRLGPNAVRRFTVAGGAAAAATTSPSTVEDGDAAPTTGPLTLSIRLADDDIVGICDTAHKVQAEEQQDAAAVAAVAAEGRGSLAPLHRVLCDALKPFQARGRSAWFVRLSWRSPKDVPEGRRPSSTATDVLTAVVKSKRCFDDLVAYRWHLLHGPAAVDSDPQAVGKFISMLPPAYLHLVPWCPDVGISTELRCFVHRGRLVALSHQVPGDMFPFVAQEEAVVRRVHRLLTEVWGAAAVTAENQRQQHDQRSERNGLYDDGCVVDVDISLDLERAMVVEFNPYHDRGSTSAGMFDWQVDEDTLYSGDHDEGGGATTELRYSGAFGGARLVKVRVSLNDAGRLLEPQR